MKNHTQHEETRQPAQSWQAFEENGLYGLKDEQGQVLIPALFDDFRGLSGTKISEGDPVVALKDGKWGITLAGGQGSWLLEPQFDYIGYPNQYAAVCKDNIWGVINIRTGQYLIEGCEMVYSDNGFFLCNGIGSYRKEGRYGLINEAYAFTPPIFDDIDHELEGPVKVNYNGEWGFVNPEGRFTTDEEDIGWNYTTD